MLIALLATATCVAIASGAPRGSGQDPTGVPPGGGPPYDGSLTSVLSPSSGGVVTGGRLSVFLRSRAPAGAIELRLNGREFPGGLSAAGGGYAASARLGGPLRQGQNLLTVSTNWAGRHDFDAVEFVVARRVPGLASVQRVLVDGSEAPIAVSARLASGADFRASLNGRDASSAFTRTGDRLVGLLGADDGVRYGHNQLVLTADTAAPGSARATTISQGFDVPRTTLIAAAGANKAVLAGQFVRLDAGRSLVPGGNSGKAFAWRLVSTPRGSNARLHGSAQVNPWFAPQVPGVYRIRLMVSAHPRRSAGLGSVPAAAPGSADTVTITAEVNNPYGIPLQSNGLRGAIVLNRVELPNTTRNTANLPGISYAVIDRTTGKSPQSGQLAANGAGLDQLLVVAKQHRGSLLVFNWIGALAADRARLAEIFKLVGGGDLPASDGFHSGSHPGSVIGVIQKLGPPVRPGSAFFNHRDIPNVPMSANMSGYLRPNGAPGQLDFVFTSYVPVDTAPASMQTSTKSTVSVGQAEYTLERPSDESGFHLVTLDPKSLALITNSGYVTNAADGTQLPGVTQLANALQASAADSRRPLVILQSFGQPKGTGDWDRVGLAIQQLGGTRQVFADLNQTWAGGVGGDPTHGRKGGYAFIGRVGSEAPRTEVSYPLDDRPARLAGLLMLTRTADYEPLMVNPVRRDGQAPVNEQLFRIANQAPTDFPELAPDASRAAAQAAENYLGGPAVMKVCPAGTTCNVRATYVTKYHGSWDTILSGLGEARTRCRQAPGVNPRVCEEVRAQLFDEVADANRVRRYFGPLGLQLPLGAGGPDVIADLAYISQQIQDAVVPPPADTTASTVLTTLSYIAKIGALGNPAVAATSSVLSAAFGLGGYLTKPDSSPNLIGPAVRTTAAGLGVQLTSSYRTAGMQLDALGRIIVSDYGKLTAVAARIDSDANWELAPHDARNELIRAAKQTISESLIPLAYPVLYDLGRVPGLNAAAWRCRYGFLGHRQKFLFNRNPAGGQVVQRFPNGWQPVMAVGAVRAVGHQNGAYIPTPPAEVVDELFKPADQDGLGMQKLEFYSPRLFRLLPANPTPPRRGDPRPNSLAYVDGRPPSCDLLPNPPGNSG